MALILSGLWAKNCGRLFCSGLPEFRRCVDLTQCGYIFCLLSDICTVFLGEKPRLLYQIFFQHDTQ